ncbi:Hypothetical predicted protein [Paramuricea clavata]|uniref:Uncharacterized protein n=1 Tax=Paramuricea clavata TaxID=317549 RepID=A0A7D9L798_PARCT|nr:Hypothetical predicted protein [Paramuricea clavata]
MEWLNNKSTWTLCWQASRHGWAASTFHTNCDFKGPTVTIVSVDAGKYVFGGYSDISWEGIMYVQKQSSSAFLFSLRNKDDLEPFKSLIAPGYELWAVYQSPYTGPAFGQDGIELYVSDNAQFSTCEANFGQVFKPPPGYKFNRKTTKVLLGGKEKFLPSEIETYYLADN